MNTNLFSIAGLHADDDVHLDYPVNGGGVATLTLGTGARVRSGTIIYSGSTIGHRLATGHNVVIRERCDIGDDVSVWSNTVVDYGCRIGDGVKIHSNCYIAQFTIIENGAFLAPGISIANDLYPGSVRSAELMTGPVIGAGAQIGVGVTILPYVTIGAGSLIGAGSVVTTDIPPGVVAVGNPARPTKRVADLTPLDERLLPNATARPLRDDRSRS